MFLAWLERTKLGSELGFGDSRNWYPWQMFEIVAAASDLPDRLMTFASNERSYQAVQMDISAECHPRRS